jgi:hypothetical protein
MSMVGEHWRISDREWIIVAEIGGGKSVSNKPDIALCQRQGPAMVAMRQPGEPPHIFDWWPLTSLLRDGQWIS